MSKRYSSISGNPVFEAALEIQRTFLELNWSFCFIGGLAVIRWGEIRLTRDIDVCLSCGFGNEQLYIEALLNRFRSRIKDAFTFALENRVILIIASNNTPIDISLSGLQYEQEMIERATPFEFEEDFNLVTCSAEDLIILKAIANRTRDWMDVEGIIMRQDKTLDTNYIVSRLQPLCIIKGSQEIIKTTIALLSK